MEEHSSYNNVTKERCILLDSRGNSIFSTIQRGHVQISCFGDTRLHKIFMVECYASGNGNGAILIQEGYHVTFTSHPMKGKNLKSTQLDEEHKQLHDGD